MHKTFECCWCTFLTRGRLETASLISERRTCRWMFLGALWYLCFLLEHRKQSVQWAHAEQRYTGTPRHHLTWSGSPPPEGRRRRLDPAPLWRSPPARALPLLPSTGCKSSSHTAQSAQSELGVAWRQNTEDTFKHVVQEHITKWTKITQFGFLVQRRHAWWRWRLAAPRTNPAEASRLCQTH